jgi:UDP-glucose 4-epimerase
MAGADSDAVGHCNIATGRETTVLELAETLRLDTVLEPERPGEVRRSCLDPTRARELIGWEARTSLDEGLARTLEAAR